MKLSIIIPVFNEETTVAAVIDKVRELEIDKEIIVINDGSTDGTRQALAAAEQMDGVRVHHSPVNLGKGSSVRIGFSFATGDIVTIQDADLELDPREYLELIKPIISGQADVVFGSRFMDGSRKGMAAFYLANRALSGFASVLFGSKLTDIETCYKVFRKDVLPKLKLRAARFEIEPELTAQVLKNGFRLLELPIAYNPRSRSEGKKISWRDGVHAFAALINQRIP